MSHNVDISIGGCNDLHALLEELEDTQRESPDDEEQYEPVVNTIRGILHQAAQDGWHPPPEPNSSSEPPPETFEAGGGIYVQIREKAVVGDRAFVVPTIAAVFSPDRYSEPKLLLTWSGARSLARALLEATEHAERG